MKDELTNLLREFIDEQYETAGTMTGVSGNHSMNRKVVKDIATLEKFLRFIEDKNKQDNNLIPTI